MCVFSDRGVRSRLFGVRWGTISLIAGQDAIEVRGESALGIVVDRTENPNGVVSSNNRSSSSRVLPFSSVT